MISINRFLLLVLAVIVVGCSNTSAPTGGSNNNGPDTTTKQGLSGPGAYLVIVGHDTLDRSKLSGVCSARAFVDASSSSLGIQLVYTPSSQFATSVVTTFGIPISGPVVKSYSMVARNSQGGVFASIDSSMLMYESLPGGGTFTITKFDTVMNLVSGTFRFTASPTDNASEIDTVSGGFNDVGIDYGAFGQGSLSAVANGESYDPSQISITVDPTNGLQLRAVDNSTPGVFRTLTFHLKSPKVGSFLFADHPADGFVDGEFDQQASVMLQVLSLDGTLTITSFDTVTRRISGTFYFSGPDTRSGATVSISSGSLNNLQWFVP